MFIKGTLTITGDAEPPAERTAAQIQIIRDNDERNKVVLLKNCTPFTAWISGINNTQIDNAKDIDVVKSMYNLIDNSNNYLKTSRSLWQYYSDKPNVNWADSESLKSETKITGSIPADGNIKRVKIVVPLKCLKTFWRNLEILVINCEINLMLT